MSSIHANILTREETERGLRSLGFSDERIAAHLAAAYGPVAIEVDRPDPDALEDAHVDEGKKLLRALGAVVYSTVSKKRVKVTPGQPDILFFLPRRRLFAWWEAKSESGRASPAQVDFGALVQESVQCVGRAAVGWYTPYIRGPLRQLEEWLLLNGVATRSPNGLLEPTPYPED